MTDSEILDLADKVARCVLRGRPCYSREDWQDATQEAACAIYAELKQLPRAHEGRLFLAAKSAICDWLRVWLRHPRGGTIQDYTAYELPDMRTRSLDFLACLGPQLVRQGARKPDEDVAYLALLLQGYSTAGIALELGITSRNVYAIRERLLPRLTRLARGEVPLSHGESVRVGIAAHRRKEARDA